MKHIKIRSDRVPHLNNLPNVLSEREEERQNQVKYDVDQNSDVRHTKDDAEDSSIHNALNILVRDLPLQRLHGREEGLYERRVGLNVVAEEDLVAKGGADHEHKEHAGEEEQTMVTEE